MNYYITTEGRAGSTLLCTYLTSLGLGIAQAWLTYDEKYSTQQDYKDQIEFKRRNGIAGVKISWGILSTLKDQGIMTEPGYEFFEKMMPDAKWIYLKRKNLVHQAVSRIRAMKIQDMDILIHAFITKILSDIMGTDAALLEMPVPVKEIRDRIHENACAHAAWEIFFDEFDISPLRIFFEDLRDNKTETLSKVCAFLGVDAPIHDAKTNLHSTHSVVNGKWYNEIINGYRRYF